MITLIFTFLSLDPAWASDKARQYKVFEVQTEVNSVKYFAQVYQPTETPIKFMLLISPTINGITSIEEANAQYFAKRGYVVIVPEPYPTELSNPNPNIEKLNADYFQPALSAISLINNVDQKLNLPPTTPIFALGASQGALSTIIVTSTIPRIKAAWFAVGGGNLPYIYAHSEVDQIEKFRANHMKILGINNTYQYEEYLRIYLKNDPVVSCKDITVPFHQVIATRDNSVPTVTQELLVDECPPHSVTRKNTNHAGGTVSTVLDRKKIMEFFESSI